MKRVWGGQSECGYLGIKYLTRIVPHLVFTLHGSDGGVDHGCAGVLEGAAGLDVGHNAHNALTVDFLNATQGVGNDPVSGNQARGA